MSHESKVFMLKQIEMLDALFKHATEGIVVSQTDGSIVMVNPIAEKIFGYDKNELMGQKIEILIPNRFTHNHIHHRDNYGKNPHPRAMGLGIDLYAKRKDSSEFPVEISLSNFNTSQGSFIMSFIIDITQRKHHEGEIQKANEQIKSLNIELENRVSERTEELANVITKLAESKQEVIRALQKEKELNELKSRFVTTASHEFRTPLATILSSVSLISRYDNPDDIEKRHKHIDRIKSSVNNLTEILNDFLSLSKFEEGITRNNPEPLEIDKFAGSIIEDLKSMTKAHQNIIYKHQQGDNLVSVDRQLLKNALTNLLSNAIKYSSKNIELYTSQINGQLFISVKDYGIGIPEDDQPHMFERFFRAKNAGNIQGTGLGLNIVKKFVELMEGKISFKSKFEEGTVFDIAIPVTKG